MCWSGRTTEAPALGRGSEGRIDWIGNMDCMISASYQGSELCGQYCVYKTKFMSHCRHHMQPRSMSSFGIYFTTLNILRFRHLCFYWQCVRMHSGPTKLSSRSCAQNERLHAHYVRAHASEARKPFMCSLARATKTDKGVAEEMHCFLHSSLPYYLTASDCQRYKRPFLSIPYPLRLCC